MDNKPVLSPHEAALILAFSGTKQALTLEQIAQRSEIEMAQARSAVERLKYKGALTQVSETTEARITLSEFGHECVVKKLPELRLLKLIEAKGELPIQDLLQHSELPEDKAGAAFGALKNSGLLVLEKGLVRLSETADFGELEARQWLLEKVSRGEEVSVKSLSTSDQERLNDPRLQELFRFRELKTRWYQLTESGEALSQQANQVRDEISRLTPAMLQDGSWLGKRFRRYNIGLPPRLVIGSRNLYRRFLDRTKSILLGMGFEEMRGSLVENEFWNMDALFMPQFHPARDIHDIYYVTYPILAKEIPEPYISNVASAHEGSSSCGSRGWGYIFDKERARRLVLRSQGTALSARKLASQPNIPGKYFSMARCFRYDSVDATHAPDFIQIEGIVLSESVNFRHLLGILILFAREVAQAKQIKVLPDYFPFTEPSVQVHIKHSVLGWIELGGAGLFRPEVTTALGIEVPVIAWGLGLDRMAMMALDKHDIRHLFTNNLPRGLVDNRSI